MPNFVTADELARNRYGSDPRLAGNEIGAALFGRGASRQAAVDKGTEQGLTLAEKFANARYNQERYISEQNKNAIASRLSQTFQRNGISKPQADQIADVLNAGHNPNEVAEALLGQQKLGFYNNAMQSATAPGADLNGLNRQLMVIDGKPQQLTKIEDNTAFNPMLTAGSQNLITTALGGAMMNNQNANAAEHGAQAGAANAAAVEHYASANASNAQADLHRQTLNAGPKVTNLTKDDSDKLFPDAATYQAFQADRARQISNGHPEYSNAELAAIQYAKSHQFDDVEGAAQQGVPLSLADQMKAALGIAPPPQQLGLQDLIRGTPSVPAASAQANPAQFTPNLGTVPPTDQSQSRSMTVGAPPQAVALLKANPSMADYFDQKYGKGSSAAVLGQ